MDAIQIVILTLLGVVAFVAFCSLINRMAAIYEDNLWIEVVIIIVVGLLAYLVAR